MLRSPFALGALGFRVYVWGLHRKYGGSSLGGIKIVLRKVILLPLPFILGV